MLSNYTAKYTRIRAGYMGQLVEWPEVITEGRTIEETRELLKDALHQMILVYRELKKEIPQGRNTITIKNNRVYFATRNHKGNASLEKALIERVPVRV